VDIESIRGKLADWVREPQVAAEVRRRFRRFLRTFTDEHGEPIYKKRLEEMIKSGWGGAGWAGCWAAGPWAGLAAEPELRLPGTGTPTHLLGLPGQAPTPSPPPAHPHHPLQATSSRCRWTGRT
jgi:hypothetical protein